MERKIFPGYVIVKMILTDESWYAVRNIRGCTGFVGPSSKPIPLTDEEVAATRCGDEEMSKSTTRLATASRLSTARWRALSEQWKRLDVDKNRIRVMVSMFGRETPVELELDQAEPVE